MKTSIVAVIFLSICFHVQGQTIELISFDSLNTRIQRSDKLTVVNFWASWCKPCLAEMPVFERLHQEFGDKEVEVILANLDFNSKVTSLVSPLVKERRLQSRVVHITDTDPNTWINKVDSSWSGAIPATVVFDKEKKIFFKEGEITYEEIKKVIR